MNTVYIQIGMSLLRWLLTGLGVSGMLSDNDLYEISGLVIALLAGAWGAYNKIRAQRALHTALELPSGSSVDTVEARMRNGMGASALVALLSVSILASACASTGKALHRADQSIYQSVKISRAAVNGLCDSRALAPDACRKAQGDLAAVIHDADTFTLAASTNSTAEVPAMLGSLERFTKSMAALLPDTAERAEILAGVNSALAQLRALVGR